MPADFGGVLMLADSVLVWVANFCVAAATIGCVYTLIAAALIEGVTLFAEVVCIILATKA